MCAQSPPVVHVATVHWRVERWIDIQLAYLERFIEPPFRTYAFLNRISGDHGHKFSRVWTEPIKSHAIKLNLLAEAILEAAEPDDWLLFLDSDAFPIAPLRASLGEELERGRLVAVRRDEKRAFQPSPCFCLTTVGTWRELGGDWRRIGNPSQAERAKRSPSLDVGALLARALDERGIEWHPLLRTNTANPHPLFYAVYGDVLYHHGAGSRPRISRFDRAVMNEARDTRLARLVDRLPRTRRLRPLRRRIHPAQRAKRRALQRERQTAARILERASAGDLSVFAELAASYSAD